MSNNQAINEMNRFCVVCEQEFGPMMTTHCTDHSLVAFSGSGRKMKFYSLDGDELSDEELSQLKETESTRVSTWKEERQPQLRQVDPSQPRAGQPTKTQTAISLSIPAITPSATGSISDANLAGGLFNILYPVNLDNILEHNLSLEVYGWFGKTRLYVNGQPARMDESSKSFVLHRKDGSLVNIITQAGMWDSGVKIIMEGKIIKIGNRVRWFEWLWAWGLPFILLVLTAVILGFPVATGLIPMMVFYFAASNFNMRVMRSEMMPSMKIIRSAFFTLLAVIGNIIFALILMYLGIGSQR